MLIGAVLLAAMPAGHGSTAPPAGTHRIEMQNMRFGTVPANIKAGDTIIWVNRDMVPHTASARDDSFDVVIPARGSARMIVRRAGRIAFHCRYHPAMRGSLPVAR